MQRYEAAELVRLFSQDAGNFLSTLLEFISNSVPKTSNKKKKKKISFCRCIVDSAMTYKEQLIL